MSRRRSFSGRCMSSTLVATAPSGVLVNKESTCATEHETKGRVERRERKAHLESGKYMKIMGKKLLDSCELTLTSIFCNCIELRSCLPKVPLWFSPGPTRTTSVTHGTHTQSLAISIVFPCFHDISAAMVVRTTLGCLNMAFCSKRCSSLSRPACTSSMNSVSSDL